MTNSAVALVIEQGKVLMIQRADSGKWSLPGGCLEPGETPEAAVIRETLEETAVKVCDPRYLLAHQHDDGDLVLFFWCSPYGVRGSQVPVPQQGECLAAAWVPVAEVKDLDLEQPRMYYFLLLKAREIAPQAVAGL
jgi:ADP-ribose pyrophosphatase YjhB (NUDIX family)